MPVYEVLHAVGEWSLKLREETPIAVRDAVTVPFGHLVITSTHLPVDRFTGSQILDAALYSGVCLRPGPGLEISGKGLAWWLDQAVLETAVTNNDATLSTWLNDILQADSGTYPVSITSGLAATVAGTLSTSFQWITRRQAIDTVVRYYWGLEWKVNPDFDLVADSVSAIYGADPVALIAARADGYEQASGLWGLSGQARTAIDFESYATRVVAVGQDQIGGATITAPYYDPQGNPLAIGRMVDAPSAGQGLATSVAAQVLATLDQPAYDFRLSAERYVISNRAPVGSYVNVYDPLNGFVDPANPVRFGGVTYFPRVVRLVGCRWPIEQGMGVYYRWYDPDDGSGPFFTDLTDYVEWETGAAELEVGSRLRGLDGSESSLASLASSPVESGAWTEYAMGVDGLSIGNGSSVGWYRKDGATLYVNGQIHIGSTSADLGGGWAPRLPDGLAAAGATNRWQYGAASVWDSSAGRVWRGVAEIQGGVTVFALYVVDNTGSENVQATVPFTFAAGDTIGFSAVIEADITAVETAAPVLAAFSAQAWATGAAITPLTPTVTSGTLPLAWSASGLPAGLSIDSATGAITGTPTSAGSGTATVTATNGAGSDSETISWTVATFGLPVDTFEGSSVDATKWDADATGPTVSGGVAQFTTGDGTIRRGTLQGAMGVTFQYKLTPGTTPDGWFAGLVGQTAIEPPLSLYRWVFYFGVRNGNYAWAIDDFDTGLTHYDSGVAYSASTPYVRFILNSAGTSAQAWYGDGTTWTAMTAAQTVAVVVDQFEFRLGYQVNGTTDWEVDDVNVP